MRKKVYYIYLPIYYFLWSSFLHVDQSVLPNSIIFLQTDEINISYSTALLSTYSHLLFENILFSLYFWIVPGVFSPLYFGSADFLSLFPCKLNNVTCCCFDTLVLFRDSLCYHFLAFYFLYFWCVCQCSFWLGILLEVFCFLER